MDSSNEEAESNSIIDYILLKYDAPIEDHKSPPFGQLGLNIYICPKCYDAFCIGRYREHHYGTWKNLSRGKIRKICIVCSI